MNCELCSSHMKEGSLGQKAWICINNLCERSNPLWKTEHEKEIQRQVIANKREIDELSSFENENFTGRINIHMVRFAGQGSGTIDFSNRVPVPFVKENDKYTFYTDDEMCLAFLTRFDFVERVERVRYLSVDRLHELIK